MFTCKCFVRLDNNEIRSKLKDLGYYHFSSLNGFGVGLGVSNFDWDLPHYFPINELINEIYLFDKWIDCNDNVQLFLALAALNDKNDYMQWFTNGKEFILCDRKDWEDMYSVLCSGGKYTIRELDRFSKASIYQLMEYFTDYRKPLIRGALGNFFRKLEELFRRSLNKSLCTGILLM